MEELGPGARITLLACKHANEKRHLTAGENRTCPEVVKGFLFLDGLDNLLLQLLYEKLQETQGLWDSNSLSPHSFHFKAWHLLRDRTSHTSDLRLDG